MVLEVTKDNWAAEVEQAPTPVIIDFWASWCGPCRMLTPIFEELAPEYEGKLKFSKCNTEEFPDIAGKFEITGIPCLIVAKEGKEVGRIVGFQPKEQLKSAVDEILSKL